MEATDLDGPELDQTPPEVPGVKTEFLTSRVSPAYINDFRGHDFRGHHTGPLTGA